MGYEGEQIIDPKEIIDRFYSLEFSLEDLLYSYRFKIQDISGDCIGIIIRPDSELINYISEGDQVDVNFFPQRISFHPQLMRCKVKKIVKEQTGRFKGHFRVYLCTMRSSNSSFKMN